MRDLMDANLRNKMVDNLYLRHPEEDEQCAAWPQLRQWIELGDIVSLANFLAVNNLDIKRIRFQVETRINAVPITRYLLYSLVDISFVLQQEKRYTPLHLAVLHNQVDVSQYLINCGVNVTLRDTVSFSNSFLLMQQFPKHYCSVVELL